MTTKNKSIEDVVEEECKCGHLDYEHQNADEYIESPCVQGGCDCEKFVVSVSTLA